MLHIRRGYFVRRYHFIFAHIRAYAIRPYTCSIDFGIYCVVCRFHIRSFEGVCDTPLRCSRGFWACVEWLVGVGLFVLKQLQHDVGGTLGGAGGT